MKVFISSLNGEDDEKNLKDMEKDFCQHFDKRNEIATSFQKYTEVHTHYISDVILHFSSTFRSLSIVTTRLSPETP